MAFVVVGGSLAGVNAAIALREQGYPGELIVIGQEQEPPYERPPLSKGYLLGDAERSSVFVQTSSWYQENAVDLRLGQEAVAVDAAAHTVTLASGEQIGYAKLLLATGSEPRRLPVPGADQPHVRYLRSLADSEALREQLRMGAHVAVIGAGWIGLEVAAAARHHGANVSIVETDALPLRRVLGDEVAGVFRDLHQAHDVTFHFGRSVQSIGADAVILDDGTSVPADVVVVGIGVAPRTALASAAGLAVDNGVLVSSSLRTSDPDIYACGDIASWEHPLIGQRIRVEHWENARQSGQFAARAMLGEAGVYDWLPYFFSDQYDLGMEYSGYAGPGEADRVVFRGDAAAREFIAFWLKENRVLAGMNVNVWDVHDDIRALATAGHSGRSVDPGKLADAQVPLGELLAS
ncbi:pyridine nucleotide-disulfide oxidoreductase [Rhizocola hellebori]|uniref:Pyridine nucleotide-disulfide oxidoreductase n=1 Tax=Rhizocola hellebori TaxID=1392758 RepID=A0A8J3QCB1_9ACTN|nr:FAD-dependent oxidoreductase [Rhizocola hellebori]GIH07966.1 pyridine nucleotide-disulfide oxidoreductase [Rhizocola hellebori]